MLNEHSLWSQRPREVQGMGMAPVWDDAPDEQLLARTRREPSAFGVFYRRHEERMRGYFLARVGDPDVAADLTAETFAAALLSAHRFRRRRKEPASAWLFGIARNNLAMSRRSGRVERAPPPGPRACTTSLRPRCRGGSGSSASRS
jgi:DNA-directed RNA polymerase specialized sigma24 family protein